MARAGDAKLKQQIDEIKSKLETEWQALDAIFVKIKSKQDEVTGYKTKRDEFNQLVKTLISEAKDMQKERDSIRGTTKPKREIIRNLQLNIKEFGKQIAELKSIRDGKHREAKGSLQGLSDNIASSLTTLLTLDLSLKDEITLFNMIFSTQQRYDAKILADDIHKQIQDIYDALKNSEHTTYEQEAQIKQIYQEAQRLHTDSVAKFEEKDEMRNKSNELHQKVVQGYGTIKDLRSQADEIKKTIAELKGELNKLHKQLRSSEKKRQEVAREEKLESAKEKLKDEKKLGLDELRLLIESGSLKK